MCLLWSERGGRVFLGTHTTRIGRERVRVHPSRREREGFLGTHLFARGIYDKDIIESQRGIRVSPIESTTALFEKKKTKKKKSCIIRPSYDPL